MNVNFIRTIRQSKGISQEALGKKVGVTRQTIAAWEKGERTPTLRQINKVARALEVPLEVLLDLPGTPRPILLFRADDPRSLPAHLRALLTQKARNYAEIERIAGEAPALPEFRPKEDYDPELVERVAREVRDWLGVEEGPLGDVLDLLEQRAIKIVAHPLPDEVSGFSAYTDEMGAVIFVNANHPTERQRFTALHELAHLIFHRKEYDGEIRRPRRGDPREKTANHLAAAVLLPAEALKEALGSFKNRWIPLPLLQDLRYRYGVSVRTVLLRARDLGLITKKQMGEQLGVINKRFGMKGEPGEALPPPKTLSRLERLTWKLLLDDKITLSRAAEVLERPLAEIREQLRAWEEGAVA